MKFLPVGLGFTLLLALLTWLLLRGIDTNAPKYAMALRAFDDYALAETSLHRDVLQARAGLLRDYDSFFGAVQAMRGAVAQLRSYAQAEGLDTRPIDRLEASVAQQEDLMELFKTNNALLQNSLSFVALVSTDPASRSHDAQLAPAMSALAAAVLYLARDRSSVAVKALQDRIDLFAALAPTAGPDADTARAMLAHTRLLHDLLPAVDETLRTFTAIPDAQPLEETRVLFARHRSVVEAGEQRFRLLLYLVSLLLLIMLALLGLRLRARAIALRTRAALEHVIAENSTSLINCSPAEATERLKQVLGEFGRLINADRAYVVLGENPVRVHTWSRSGEAFPPGWPQRALGLSEQLGVAEPDNVAVTDIAALPPGPVKEALTKAGARAWVSVPLVRPGRLIRSIMGFDYSKPIRNWNYPAPIVRLAGDAVANAVEREFLERDKAKLTVRLERARRMQMVGSLASGIAHNFNNIIGAIVGYSEMIEPHLTRGSKPTRHIEEIRRAAERGRDLVDNILTFGRRTDTLTRPVQLRTLLDEAASLLRASFPSGVEFVFGEASPDLAVSGQPAQLQQVIINLCTNAAQAMEDGGCIRVTTVHREVTTFLRMSDGELSRGRYACIAVSDNGRGFDKRVARRIFEPFFTTRLGGTGLGLATVREIVRDHEGAIDVQSEPGRGSRFEVWLPALAADSVAMAGQPSLPLGRGETVMIVESESDHLLRDEEKLAALGYEPVGFEQGDDALGACRSEPDRFDIFLVTQGAQTYASLDLARALHQIAPFRPVLLAAASTIDVSVNALTEAGISEVLRWPLTSSELAAALARCLRRSGTLQL
ncbi:two-component system VirA-like sensor kinase [Bradyrhizobium pachyrhizi]|uniref:two-component system VirA-like sensor kinase n=1 Tax=Bradyrhizobium pachyrhizi TaxID=280333 RepID=UPI003D36243E